MVTKRFQPTAEEIPLTLTCDGLRLRIPLENEWALRLNHRYGAGVNMMFELLSRDIPFLQEIRLNGIALKRSGNAEPEFHVFTVSVRTAEASYHLRMEDVAGLLRDNGIPYARLTDLQALP